MKSKKLITNSKGFSLTSAIVMMGILTTITMAVTRVLNLGNKSMGSFESTYDIINITDRIRLHMLSRKTCSTTFAGEQFPDVAANEETIAKESYFDFDKIITESGTRIIDLNPPQGEMPIGTNTGGKVELVGMTLANVNGVGILPSDPNNPSYIPTYGEAELRLKFKRKGGFGGREIIKTLAVTVELEPGSQTIKKCHSNFEEAINSAYEKVCEDLEGKIQEDGKCAFFNLYRGQHTQKQCINAGGTIEEYVVGGKTEMFCGFYPSSTPAGWNKFYSGDYALNTTVETTATDSSCSEKSALTLTASNYEDFIKQQEYYQSFKTQLSKGCTTGSHIWSPKYVERCTITCTEKKPCLDKKSCRSYTKTLYAKVTKQAYY